MSADITAELRAFGVAQVIVVLRQATAAAVSELTAAGLEQYFVASSHSHVGAMVDAAGHDMLVSGGAADSGGRFSSAEVDAEGRLAAAAIALAPSPMRYYANLGVVYGAVTREGLEALRAATDRVLSIRTAPAISPVRPTRITDARLRRKVTWGIRRLGIPALWKQGLTGQGVVVGHLDTGVDGSHPALRGAIAAFTEFDGFGREVQPVPAVRDTDTVMGGHGSHTAATIAGRPVKGKTVGVAPGAKLACAVVIEGGDIPARVLGGLDWAIGRGVRIVNISLGLRGWRDAFQPILQALRTNGVLPVVAVGNEGPGTSRSPGNYPESLSVGAVDDRGHVWRGSSSQLFVRKHDPIVPDLVAPGVSIVSARPGGGYRSMTGTSMATPHISGLAALLFEARPQASVAEVEQAIYASCQRPPDILTERGNRGIPNGPRALAALLGS